MSLDVTSGFNFDGGHDENHGLDANGNLIAVPLHRHAVSLDFTHIETEVQRTFSGGLDVWMRLSYDVKDQTAKIVLVDPATPAEQDAMERNSHIHHRSETYTGVSDAKLLTSYWHAGVLRSNDAVEIAIGSSIPIGKTQPNPLTAGDEGLEHLHIQFGSGTFDPLLEAYYATPIAGSLVMRLFSLGRFPLYENNKTYRAPVDISSGLSLARDVMNHVSARVAYTFSYQGYAEWNDVRDPNSGLLSNSVVVGATAAIGWSTNVGLGYRYSFAQRTLSDEGDTFEQGPTILFTLTRALE